MDSQNIPENEEILDSAENKLLKSTEDSIKGILKEIDPNDIKPETSQDGNTNRLKYIYSESSPIPSPKILQAYDDVYPGFAEKLLDSFIEEGKHRRELESRSLGLKETELELEKIDIHQRGELLKANYKRSNWGLIAGFVISLTALGLSYFATIKGHEKYGIATVVGTVGTLATVFVIGKKSQETQQEKETEDDKN